MDVKLESKIEGLQQMRSIRLLKGKKWLRINSESKKKSYRTNELKDTFKMTF